MTFYHADKEAQKCAFVFVCLDVPCQKYEENINLFRKNFLYFLFLLQQLKKRNLWIIGFLRFPLCFSSLLLCSQSRFLFDFICREKKRAKGYQKIKEDYTKTESEENFFLVGTSFNTFYSLELTWIVNSISFCARIRVHDAKNLYLCFSFVSSNRK